MLSKALAVTTIAVTDLDRAKGFYSGTLGSDACPPAWNHVARLGPEGHSSMRLKPR